MVMAADGGKNFQRWRPGVNYSIQLSTTSDESAQNSPEGVTDGQTACVREEGKNEPFSVVVIHKLTLKNLAHTIHTYYMYIYISIRIYKP